MCVCAVEILWLVLNDLCCRATERKKDRSLFSALIIWSLMVDWAQNTNSLTCVCVGVGSGDGGGREREK